MKFIIKKIIAIYILVTICVFNCAFTKIILDKSPKIHKNIYIEDINIGNLSVHDAKNTINKKYYPKTININYEDKIWSIKPQDIDLNYNVEKAISEAILYTRTEDKFLNIKRMFNLKFKTPFYIKLKATYSENKLSNIIKIIENEINKKDKKASIYIEENSQIKTTDSKNGIEVDTINLKEKIYNMIENKETKDIYLPIKIIKPKIDTNSVKSINSILGQYSTSFYDKSSRGSNIHIAGNTTSDILVMPGDIFSYNNTTGARTWSNGYKLAKVIIGGRYVNGEGGGVCQVSTNIYNAALLSGMEIVEVHNHTYPSRYSPKGKDAAVSYGYTDFKFKNPYKHPIYIKNIVKNGAITTKIYGSKEDKERIYVRTEEKYDKDKILVKTYRVYLDQNNKKIREELISTSKYKIKPSI